MTLKVHVMMNELAARAGVDAPPVHVFEHRNPQAFTDFGASVHISTGMIKHTNPSELRAVMSHELGHIVQNHPLQYLIIRLCLFGLIVYYSILLRMDVFAFASVTALAWAIDCLFVVCCELRADRFAAENSGQPMALVSYLCAGMSRRRRYARGLLRPVGFPIIKLRMKRLVKIWLRDYTHGA